MLPLAHAGHYALWFLYVLPVLVVAAAIVRGQLMPRRDGATPAGGDDREDSAGRQSPRSETGPAGRKP
jgi:hypothetical protein